LETCRAKCDAYSLDCDYKPSNRGFIYGSTCDSTSVVTNNDNSTTKIVCAHVNLTPQQLSISRNLNYRYGTCIGSSLCLTPDLMTMFFSGWYWKTKSSPDLYGEQSVIYGKAEKNGYHYKDPPRIFGSRNVNDNVILTSNISAPKPKTWIIAPPNEMYFQKPTKKNIAMSLLSLFVYSYANGDGLGNAMILLPCLPASPHWIPITKIASGSSRVKFLECGSQSLLCVRGDARVFIIDPRRSMKGNEYEIIRRLKDVIVNRAKKLKLQDYVHDLASI
jgi:hypothetical protein